MLTHGHDACLESLEPRWFLSATLFTGGLLEILGTKKADTIFVTLGEGVRDQIRVRVNRNEFSFTAADVSNIVIQAGPSNDLIEFRAFARTIDRFAFPVKIYGSGGDDVIIGPGSNARIYGGDGSDRIVGGQSRDIIYGQAGNDTLEGGSGNDYLSGGDGDDRLLGGLGQDVLQGDAGNDVLLSRGDVPFREDFRPFFSQAAFDQVDGGAGIDAADADSFDRLISVEGTFVQR